jgi:hypothetical protein
MAWHDAMVNHLRAVTMRGARCEEGCPHEAAGLLWLEAVQVFGESAEKLAFLRHHGSQRAIPPAAVSSEARV